MGFGTARIPEGRDILAPIQEVRFEQGIQTALDGSRWLRQLKGRRRLLSRELGCAQERFDVPLAPFLQFQLT